VRQLTPKARRLQIAGCTAGLFLSPLDDSLLVRYIAQSDFPVFLDLRPNAAIFACAVALAGNRDDFDWSTSRAEPDGAGDAEISIAKIRRWSNK